MQNQDLNSSLKKMELKYIIIKVIILIVYVRMIEIHVKINYLKAIKIRFTLPS